MQKIKLALCQHASPAEESEVQIWQRFESLAKQAAGNGADVIVTQELFLGWYFCQGLCESRFELAEAIPGPRAKRLSALSKELGVVLHASLFEEAAPGLYYNTSVTFERDGRLVGKYRKMHIPHDPRFEEKYYFAPGDLGFQVHQTSPVALGSLICWDQWYPEAARATALKGAELLVYPTAIGYYNDSEQGEPESVREAQLAAWIAIQRSHAIANGVYVAACNRVGVEHDLTFWGSSFIFAPDGTLIAQASKDKDEVLMAELDPDAIRIQRQGWPFFRDRRVDAYGELQCRMIGDDS